MLNFLRTIMVVGLLVALTGTAQAVIVGGEDFSGMADLGVPGDPDLGGSFNFLHNPRVDGSGFGAVDDHGFFLFQELVGDGSISVQVRSISGGTSPSRMGGVMIRQSLDADSNYAGNFAMPTDFSVNPSVKHAKAQARSGGSFDGDLGTPANVGLLDYFKVTRSGDDFSFAWSPNGTPGSWVPYGETATVPMTGIIDVGLALTSNQNGTLTTLNFGNVDISGFATPTTLTWDELGSDAWLSPSWLPAGTPDSTTHVVVGATNPDTITVGAGGGAALSLAVDSGVVRVANGQTLSVEMDLSFAPGGAVESELSLAEDSTLVAKRGGSVANLSAPRGDVTIDTWEGLTVDGFAGAAIPSLAGTLLKEGAGTLQLDNTDGTTVNAPWTTFHVAGGALASTGVDPLGGSQLVILDGADLTLANPGGAIVMGADVSVTGDATLDASSDAGASLGALSLDAVKLTTSGSGGVGFTSTNIGAGVASVELKTSMDTSSGPINVDVDPVTIIKSGGAMLIVSQEGANLENATFQVNDGALVGVAASNPFGGANLELNGGEVILANDGGDDPAVFDNALRLTADSDLTGGTAGLSIGGAPNVQLGGVNGVDLNGKQLYVGTTDGYTLDLAGAFTNSGEVRMEDGNVILSGGGGGDAMDARTVGNGTLTISTNLLTLDDLRTRSAGTISIAGEVIVTDDLSIKNGGTVQTTAPLSADDVEVTDGTLNTADVLTVGDWMNISGGTVNLGATATAPEVAISGSALVSANELVISDKLEQGAVTYSVGSGTFTASGSDLLAGVNIAFGGNTLTVSPPAPVPLPTAGLLGKWTFDNDTAADSSGNGYDGVLNNGAYSDDVAGVLGGRSLDLTSGDSYVMVDTGGDQDVFDGGDSITISTWVKGWPDGGWEPFVSKGGESSQGWQIRRRSGSSNDLVFTTRGLGGDDDHMDDSSAPGNDRDHWHLVTATYDGARRRLYVDGELRFTDGSDRGPAINPTTSQLVFGAMDASGWGGGIERISHVRLDDIYIYDQALGQDEITSLYQNGVNALDLATTNLLVTDDATLLADTSQTATFGELGLEGGSTLELLTDAVAPISFGSLSGNGNVDGSIEVRDLASPGNSVGVLNVIGDLTLADGAVYDWDLESNGSDTINVSGNLAALGDWTLKVDTNEPLAAGQHVLFSFGGLFALPLRPDFDLSEAPNDWKVSKLSLAIDAGGNVLLNVVPEPSTWIMLLTAGLAGLAAYRRRRRA